MMERIENKRSLSTHDIRKVKMGEKKERELANRETGKFDDGEMRSMTYILSASFGKSSGT